MISRVVTDWALRLITIKNVQMGESIKGVGVKRLAIILGLGAAMLGGARNAQALSLTPANTTCKTDINTNLQGTALYTILDACFDVDAATLDLLYKKNVDDGSEEGSFRSSYETTFANSSTDPQDA